MRRFEAELSMRVQMHERNVCARRVQFNGFRCLEMGFDFLLYQHSEIKSRFVVWSVTMQTPEPVSTVQCQISALDKSTSSLSSTLEYEGSMSR
ncbi:hypothetical protein CEXT_486451 [Caerostris extrusa]|uniref:Uncharacterized protein n=1 Tax=Caerostris extrusa TaxID=172846 RepID=A0AAV4SP77_CAEEX|nr:hypothetical protein CEXT_486451 [Caerostris extrusa]